MPGIKNVSKRSWTPGRVAIGRMLLEMGHHLCPFKHVGNFTSELWKIAVVSAEEAAIMEAL